MVKFIAIITKWSLLWILLSIFSVMSLLASHLSPSWLMGQSLTIQPPKEVPKEAEEDELIVWHGTKIEVRPSLGIWLRCTVIGRSHSAREHCGVYATNVPDLPSAQIISTSALVAGTVLTVLCCIASLLATCCRTVKRKSVFNVIGALQALGGVLCILGLCLFPMFWNSGRVQILCGPQSAPYNPGSCNIGWAFYAGITGTLLIFVTSIISIKADRSISSPQVEDEVEKGNCFICVM